MKHQEYFDYFQEIRNHYSTYHNHKEIMAWSGLVLYLVAVGFIIRTAINIDLSCLISAIISILVACITILTFLFIRNQLEMKDIGGAYVATSIWYIAQILNNNFSTKELEEHLKIKVTYEEKAQAKLVLPQKVISKAEQLNTRARIHQDITKMMIYGLLFSFFCLSIGSIWFVKGS